MWVLVATKPGTEPMRQYHEYCIDSAEDIENPPDDAQYAIPSSVAYIPGLSRLWQKANDGSWVEIGG